MLAIGFIAGTVELCLLGSLLVAVGGLVYAATLDTQLRRPQIDAASSAGISAAHPG